MSAMEQSLRRALDAGDPADPAFRESIYAASERALERMIAAKPMDDAGAHEQRVRLAETINQVEAHYYALHGDPAAPAAAANAASGDGDGGVGESEETDFPDPALEDPAASEPVPDDVPAPEDATHPADRLRFAPDGDAGRAAIPVLAAGRAAPSRSRRVVGAVILLLLAGLSIAAYVVYSTIFPSAATSGAASGANADGTPSDGTWIALFDGRQLSAIATPAGGRVEAVTGVGERPAVRIGSAGEGAEIEVAVGAGAVSSLAGRTVRVELTVGSPDGQPRAFGVRCLFGGETACGRQRFTTTQASEAFVFDMTVPAGTREAGSIALDPGIGGEAKALDLYGVRARVPGPA